MKVIRRLTPEMLENDEQLNNICRLRRLSLVIDRTLRGRYAVTSLTAATFEGTRDQVVAYVIGYDAAVDRCQASFDKLELDIHAILKEHR